MIDKGLRGSGYCDGFGLVQGWGVRAAEAISRGTFVCEYVGEVLND